LRLVGRDALKASTIYAVLFLLHWYMEGRPLGEYLRNFEYTFLQQALISEASQAGQLRSEDPGIPVVVDISPFRLDRSRPTDREKLDELIEALQAKNAAAIGIDVDLSPKDDGTFITPRDPQFFLKWMRRPSNVRAGVFRRGGDLPGRWLGRCEFRDLAAGMMLPEGDPQYAFHFVVPAARTTKECDYLLQLPAALYAFLNPGSRPCSLPTVVPGSVGDVSSSCAETGKMPPLPGSIEDPKLTRESGEDGRVFVGRYPIDYSFLDRIQKIRYAKTGDLDLQEGVDRRVVFIGDLSDADDTRCTAHRRDPLPGVMIHACAFATLSHGLLWNVEGEASYMFDVSLFGFVMAVIGALRSFQLNAPNLAAHNMEIICFGGAALFVLTASAFFVKLNHLFWPDFLWIAAGLFLHPYLAEVFGIALTGLRGSFRTYFSKEDPTDAH
jgi:hypothetical protein